MSKEIVDILSKYDTTHAFTLDAFERVFRKTHYNNTLLKRESLTSTTLACFSFSFLTFSSCLFVPFVFGHNGTSLLNYVRILQNMKKANVMACDYAKYHVKSMVGFLYYVMYKE